VPTFSLPSSAEITRVRPLHRLAEPWLERRFVYARYAAFLDRLTAPRFEVVPLRELGGFDSGTRVLVGLRHDVDSRIDSALAFARLEHDRGLRSTYFVLHTAGYYARADLVPKLRALQDLGHEVGLHYDLVTAQVVEGADPRALLASELERLRSNGIDVVGVSAHGSYWAHRLGYKNDYFFRDLPSQEGFPNTDRVGDVVLAKGELAEFGLEYDASQLAELHNPSGAHYWTDAVFDESGRRWHTDFADLDALPAASRAVALVHPCLWDRSLASKYARTVARLARRLASASRRR
jgi:hypothetical protein